MFANGAESTTVQSCSSISWNGSGTVLTALNLPALFRCSFSNLYQFHCRPCFNIYTYRYSSGWKWKNLFATSTQESHRSSLSSLVLFYLKKFHSPLLMTSRAAKNSPVTLVSTCSKFEWRTVCNHASLRTRFSPCMTYRLHTSKPDFGT